jgi:hypothetical protein
MAYSTVLLNGLQSDTIINKNISESEQSWIGQFCKQYLSIFELEKDRVDSNLPSN